MGAVSQSDHPNSVAIQIITYGAIAYVAPTDKSISPVIMTRTIPGGDHPDPGGIAQHHTHQGSGQEDAVVELDIGNEQDRDGAMLASR